MPNFKISAALKDLIGKELITDEFVAVFELVKNSFDANATNVKVIFENNHKLLEKDARIVIVDDGKGMNYNDLENKWLFVAYSAKRLGTENEDYRDKIKVNRVFAGAKGVGRFSCDRLGSKLNLISIKDEPNAKIENLAVDWEAFEGVDDEEFIDIDVSYNVLPNIDYSLKHGTILEVSNLRDSWDRDRILKLKKSLAKLINPSQDNDSDNFSIEIIAEDELLGDVQPDKKGNKNGYWDIVNGEVKNTIFETLEIKTSNILVQITPDGKYIETTLQDRGDFIYYLKEKNPFGQLKNINIYLFQLNRAAKANFTKQMGMESVKYGSVFIYKNGFRIYPYGEPGDDSLKLNNRKQQGYNRFFGTRDLIGRIEINGYQDDLREITSRDGGLVKTKAYHDLVDFFTEYALRRLENYVVNIVKWGDPKFDRETKELIHPELMAKDVKIEILTLISGYMDSKNIIEVQYDDNFLEIIKKKQEKSVDKIIRNVSKVAEKSGNPELIKEAKKIGQAVKKTRQDAKKAEEKEKEAEQRAKDEKEKREKSEQKLGYVIGQNIFLKDEISDDTKNLESILHHIGLTTNLVRIDIKNLVVAINKNADKKELIKIINRINIENQKINSFSKYFKKVNFNVFSKKVEQDIIAFINQYISNVYQLRDDLKQNKELLNISFNTPIDAKLKLKFSPINLIIIIDNLINNSLKSKADSLSIEWKNISEKSVTLSIKDNGSGINDNILDHIFDFGFTTTKSSGLGLYHVKEIIEKKIKGKIAVNNKTTKGVEFLITFNK